MIPLGTIASGRYVPPAPAWSSTYLGRDVGGTQSAGFTYSFTSKPLGTAAANREIFLVAFIFSSANSTITQAVTIGGVTATALGSVLLVSDFVKMQFFRATVPTGTSGTISVQNTSGDFWNGLVIQYWGVTGTIGTVTAASATGTSGATITGPASGVILAAAGFRNSGTWTFTNATVDDGVFASGMSMGAARSSTAGSTTITAQRNAGSSFDGTLLLAVAVT